MRATLLICALMFGLPSFADDDQAAKYPDLKKIEDARAKNVSDINEEHQRKLLDADEKRLKAYQAIYDKVKKTNDLEKTGVVIAKIKDLEAAKKSALEGDVQMAASNPLKILSAIYGAQYKWVDVTAVVKARVGNQKRWNETVDQEFFGPNPDPTAAPFVVIRYSFKGKTSVYSSLASKVFTAQIP